MKIINRFFISLFLIFALLSGCSQQNPIFEIKPGSTVTPLKNTIESQNTVNPYPTINSTNLPTLSIGEAQLKYLDLLDSNGNCHLPCFWGLTPGISGKQEANSVLIPLMSLSRLADSSTSPKLVNFVLSEGDFDFNTKVEINYADDGIINRIFFHAQLFQVGEAGNPSAIKPIFNSGIFTERFHSYMLPTILTNHGKPEVVFISTDGGSERGEEVPGFYLLLVYPEQGILVNYTTSRKIKEGVVLGCPSDSHVELYLFPEGQNETISEILSETYWANIWPVPSNKAGWQTIEQATSMTSEDFYDTYRQPTSKCIETPLDNWPVPSP